MTSRIVCAALRAEDGSVIIGIRHYSPDMLAQIEKRVDGDKFWNLTGDAQGFVDQYGTYYRRAQAWVIAEQARQIVHRVGGDDGKLYSENLY